MGYFQSSEAKEATDHLRDHGLPILRRILMTALDEKHRGGDDDVKRREAHLFALKVLCAHQLSADVPLIVRAAHDPVLADSFVWWPAIFGMITEGHPEAVEICERLSDPLPNGFATTPYLDFANALARRRAISRHPFDSGSGIARLSAFLADRDPESYGSAISATASIPFLNADIRQMLLDSATGHPDVLVRIEAAWAMASLGSEIGRRRLDELCLDARYAERASAYLDELGFGRHVSPETSESDFRAMTEMVGWLAHPLEFGRPPDEITQYDSRELNWPPTGKRHRLWLFKFRYDARGEYKGTAGVGLVGSTTFALHDTGPDLAPEDVYGLHCCWELRGDPTEPKECTAEAGRKLIAQINPDFARA
jgi:hypothetical protein